MFDHADEIAAALVLCLAAAVRRGTARESYSARLNIWTSQARQIFKLIADEDKKTA